MAGEFLGWVFLWVVIPHPITFARRKILAGFESRLLGRYSVNHRLNNPGYNPVNTNYSVATQKFFTENGVLKGVNFNF
jgi:hypothetical protein